MAYTKKNIKNLTGGVSQQPDSERFDNQCTAQTNFSADPIKGLTKRAGTNYVEYLNVATSLQEKSEDTFTHLINRSTGEQLMLVVDYNTHKMELFKLNETDDDNDGDEELTITGLTSKSHTYLGSSTATNPLSAVTIADYTFLANKAKTPALKATTSGGVGMYEREHVRRGLIFVKESAYNSEFTVKATDSEGTVRSIKVFTGTGTSGDSRQDIKTDAVAGAMHYALEDTTATRSDRSFTAANAPSYTEENTGISVKYSDDGTNLLWNGAGGSTALRGSNYSNGKITFAASLPADNNSKREISIDAGSSTKYFAFTGGASKTVGATDVTMGATVLECADNLAAAINADADLNWRAAVHQKANGVPYIQIYSTAEEDVSADGNGTMAHADIANVTTTSATGGHGTLTSATSSARNPITFERVSIEDSSGVAQTSGSVISWFASYPTKAEADASLIKIEVGDSFGDTMVQTFTDDTDRISTLPSNAPNNYLIKVEGDVENDADDHYIKFTNDSDVATTNQFGDGKWKEDMQSGLQYQLDETTMPHQLIKVNSTTYKFEAATWSDKTVGDANSDAAPSFIGNPINDIFFYKSRLGMLAGESVVMSEVDNAFNFWNTSVINSVDSDRIDISSSVNEITYLNWAIPFANQLVIFSDRAQFLLTQGNQGLTPSTAALSLGSSYENSTIARPVVNDNTIIFAQEKSGASAVYEMYPTGSTELSFEATNISEHIPSYISGKIINIHASSLASTVVVETDSNDSTLYVYRYYNSGKKRVQSAWSKYVLACNHLKIGGFLSDKFHLIEGHYTITGDEVGECSWILSYMKFDNTDSLSHSVDLAFDVPTAKMQNHATTKTRIEVEWLMAGNTDREGFIVVFDKTTNTVYPVDVTTSTNDQYVYVTGVIHLNTNIVIGIKFTASYEFSKQYIKRASADGKETAVTDGRTTNKWVEVFFNDTQHLTSTVTFPSYAKRTTSTKTFSGNPDNTISGVRTGEQPSETESLRTSVAARNDLPTITLSSATHQTVTITGAAFELMHTSRTSRTN
tara:strand:- start:474 stop:3581 length:3108 start_codon:yes stop_codon:yes gene_type:complete